MKHHAWSAKGVAKALTATALALGCLTASTSARAEKSFTAGKGTFRMALLAGLAPSRTLFVGETKVSPYGVGMGFGGGVTLSSGIYFGLEGQGFFGQTENAGGFSARATARTLSADLGYDVGLSKRLTIRPGFGWGVVEVDQLRCAPPEAGASVAQCTQPNWVNWQVSPGASVLFEIAEHFYVEGRGRYLLALTSSSEEADKTSAVQLAFAVGAWF